MSFPILLANVFHGLFALVWCLGLRRMAGPIGAARWANLLAAVLVAPPLVALARLLGAPSVGDAFTLLRADLWGEAMTRSPWPVRLALGALLGGTVLLFLVQEVLPSWRNRRGRLGVSRSQDGRLDRAFEEVQRSYEASGFDPRHWRSTRIWRLETTDRIAATHGVLTPAIFVSGGLADHLDEEELRAVIAHELAHLVRGGNLPVLILWGLRALQAASPGALVAFRLFIEAQEAACDALAARVTHKPAALASALLCGARGTIARESEPIERARSEVLHRADEASTQLRVEALLGAPSPGPSPLAGGAASCVALVGVLIWWIQ